MQIDVPKNHLCKVTLLGNLVSKPDIRYQANPVIAVAELTLATHSRWYDKTTKQFKEWTSYHTVKVIGDIVDRALIHADKGDIILIHGNGNEERKALEILCKFIDSTNLQFLKLENEMKNF